LSQCSGLISSAEYLKKHFVFCEKGVVVYKKFGMYYSAPVSWKIAPNEFIEENVNPNKTELCASGVNFATKQWFNVNADAYNKNIPLWECLIHWIDLADVVVPFNTDGKCRCARLQLIKTVGI